MNMYTENREWKIKGKLDAKKRDMKYSCCVEHYPGNLSREISECVLEGQCSFRFKIN